MALRAASATTLLLAAFSVACVGGFGPGTEEEPPPPIDAPRADLPAPEALRAVSGVFRAVPLQWDPVLHSVVSGYVLERSDRREGPFERAAVIRGRGAMTHLDRGTAAGLGDGATRYYRVRSMAADGRVAADASPIAVATTAPPPDPPPGLNAFSRQPREVPLRWQASKDETVSGYDLERSPSPEGPFEVVARLQDRHVTGYVDRGLGNLRVFYYRVVSRNRAGVRGEPSPAVRAVTKPEPLPPVGLRLVQQGLGVNVLAWEPNVESDLGRYLVYRRAEDGSEPTLACAVGAEHTTAEDAAVGAGEQLLYSVVAVDRDGLVSAPSEPIVVQGPGYDLSAELHAEGLQLKWRPRADEGFQAARITRTAWFSRRQSEVVSGDHYVDRTVRRGRRYRYVVVLLRPDGSEAPASRPLEVEIPEGAGSR